MTLQDLLQLVDDQRRDTTSNFVDSDEIKRYFNTCGRDLQADHNFDFTATSAGITYVTGSNAYALSAIGNGDLKSPINIFAGYNYQFDYVSPQDFQILSALGRNVWSIDGSYMMIANSTNNNQLSASYYSSYMAKTSGGSWIAELSSYSDEPLMPSRHQDVFVEYALMMIFSKEGLNDDYMKRAQRYEKRIRDLKTEYISRKAVPLNRWKHVNEMNGGIIYDRKSDPLGTGTL